ncbi:PHB depolymerase family esterase [Bradyrhizobium sp. SYSU BS000235]|uniref:extracellular catalytic domain type 1 short-chain-length polyhydroxyalkanoate depolymerase n=1 Tax=Bradyrhizobium sp. SYSU BS000235 TaxID=3411332 RepID=UPI003C75E3CF
MSLAKNIEFLRRLPKLDKIAGLGGFHRSPGSGTARSPLIETSRFGSNPGNLRMLSFVPESIPPKSGLVVVLHGCTQNARGYDAGAGWSTLAERYGFALLMPEQTTSNNANGCFNWFNPEDTIRGSGEALSIRQMIDHMVRKHGIDPQHIFVTGLSAGGAMTSVMLATYPEVFAGGAIIAGLPYGVASNVKEALSSMFQAPYRSHRELGDLVRRASPHQGPWPKLSVWHGSADRTVNPVNADEIIKQWLDVHGLPLSPKSEDMVDGHPRKSWRNSEGQTAVESFTISNMAHGTPLGIAENGELFGTEGAFLIETGISSSFHIAKFFGLTGKVHKARETSLTTTPPVLEVLRNDQQKQSNSGGFGSRTRRRQSGIDVNAVITRALTAAGLMK